MEKMIFSQKHSNGVCGGGLGKNSKNTFVLLILCFVISLSLVPQSIHSSILEEKLNGIENENIYMTSNSKQNINPKRERSKSNYLNNHNLIEDKYEEEQKFHKYKKAKIKHHIVDQKSSLLESSAKSEASINNQEYDLCTGDCSNKVENTKLGFHEDSRNTANIVVSLEQIHPNSHGRSHALLETNHKLFKEGKKIVAYRGEGPFGSIGFNPNEPKRKRQASEIANNEKSRVQVYGGVMLEHGFKSDESVYNISVPIMQLKDSQYVAKLGIGTPPQYIRPIFDTGSTNLWVVDSNCNESTCKRVKSFNSEKSGTFFRTNPDMKLGITFGTGKINGRIGTDNMKLENLVVHNQSFGLIEHEFGNPGEPNVFEDINFEGIIGLAFPDMSSTGSTPFYDNLINQHKLTRNEFSFYMSKISPISALFVGGVNHNFYEGEIQWLPVVREHYWETDLDEIWLGNQKICCDEKSYLIFDSGTSFNTAPQKDFAKIIKIIPKTECESPESLNGKYPMLIYKIKNVKIELQPSEYMIISPEGKCRPGFMHIEVPSEYGHAYILGSAIFMKNYFTVFKRGDGGSPSMVGIAKAVHTSANQKYLKAMLQRNQELYQ